MRLPKPKCLVAADYGGKWDITRAVQALLSESPELAADPAALTPEMIEGALSLSDLPLPDLCIRTGGEHRISNFLLWQFAYAELYFTDVLWPDFTPADLEAALAQTR